MLLALDLLKDTHTLIVGCLYSSSFGEVVVVLLFSGLVEDDGELLLRDVQCVFYFHGVHPSIVILNLPYGGSLSFNDNLTPDTSYLLVRQRPYAMDEVILLVGYCP